MKNSIALLLAAAGAAALLLSASAQPANDQPGGPPNNEANPGNVSPPDAGVMPPDQGPPDQGAMNGPNNPPDQPATAAPAGNQPVTSIVILPKGGAPKQVASAFAPPDAAAGTNANDLNLNFKNAPLDMVLSYLSDAAGFIIVQDTRVNGTVTVMGRHLTQDEAVSLLNAELNRNNYAAIRDGRTLTIVNKSDAKTRNIPVMTGNDPSTIPNNDEIATWIIPIRFVDAQQLVSDLSSFVSPQATIVANQAGNSIIVTDTQANIRHLAQLIQAVDNSAEAETEIRVFRLKYANPTDVATELGSVFPSSSSTGGSQSPIRFGGAGGGGGRGGFFAQMMANAAGGNNSSNDRVKKETQVTAVADARIQAVIVTAPKDLMSQIADMMTSLDVSSDRDQGVYVFQMKNGDPQQAVQVLQSMFQSTTASRGNSSSSSSTTSALQQRTQNGATTMGTTTTTSGIGNSTSGGTGGGGGARQF